MWQDEIKNYEEAMEYREAVSGSGIVLGLNTMKMLAQRLGNPQNSLKFIHVAGTNGKGSVSCFLASILKCAGYRVGRYNSPAVFSELETVRIGDRNITKADYVLGMEAVRKAAEQMEQEGYAYPTVFEIETALAFWYFKEKQCDIVVLETGMGGIEDATNIVSTTIAAVLTSISKDHIGILGNTIAEIASQKAGIIKKDCVVVSHQQVPEAMEVIEAVSQKLEVPLAALDLSRLKRGRNSINGQIFSYAGYDKLEISMLGAYQVENAALAVLVTENIKEQYPVSEKMLRKGLKEAFWKGRFTVLAKKPYFVIDGAHNIDAAIRLKEAVESYFTNKKIVLIMGILKDKDYEAITALLAPLSTQVITVTTPRNKRAFPAYELAEVVKEYQPNVTAADSLQEAVEMGYLLAAKEDVILAFGSLSYLGELSGIVENRDKIRRDFHGKSRED